MMRIIIEYEASWRNRFLDGSNNNPIPLKGRKFISSINALNKNRDNYQTCTITKDTVMGILNRLIGDQRKLYQSRRDPNYYFKEIEPLITENDIIDKMINLNQEVVYLRNLENEDPSAFEGLIKADHPAFIADFAHSLWSILFLPPDQLIQFIVNPSYQIMENEILLNPITIIEQIAQLKKMKIPQDELDMAFAMIKQEFPDEKLSNSVKPITLFFSALYLQVKRLAQSYDLTSLQSKRGKLPGIAMSGCFTEKDFWKIFSTGGKKRVLGNPYILAEKKKGEGQVILQKADGQLTINLNIAAQQAQDLQQKISDAGVSSFYIGKKGLAYVTDIK